MNKIAKAALMAFICLFLTNSLSAQFSFVVDALRYDSACIYQYDGNMETVYKQPKIVGYLKNGTEVFIAESDTIMKKICGTNIWTSYTIDRCALVTYKGEQYLMSVEDLVLGPNNAPETRDFINAKRNNHNAIGHFYGSMRPYSMIFVLLLIATVFAFFTGGKNGPRMIPVFVVPILLTIVIAMEVVGIFTYGKEMLWWLDTGRYGLGMGILRFVIFGIALIMQVFSMKLYKRGLAGEDGDLEVRRFFWAPIIALAIPAAVAAITGFIGIYKDWHITVALIVGLIVMVFMIIQSTRDNMDEIGNIAGLVFSIFAFVYVIGLIVTVVLFIMGFIKAFLEMIIMICAIGLAMFIMGKAFPKYSYYKADGTRVDVYEE